MKTLLSKVVIVAMALCAVSCSEFLKEDPKGQMMSSTSFSSETDLTGSLNALNKVVDLSVKHHGTWIPWMQGDDISTHPVSNKGPAREFDVMKISDENGVLTINTAGWYSVWRVIKCANFIINGADNTPGVTQEQIDFVKGQAYYWRAYFYFYLVRIWGPVPLILSGEIDLSIAPSTVSEVFDQIVSDMQEAEKLPVKYTAVPYAMNGVNVAVSRPAAQASLAYIYLYMAGWPLNNGNEYYQKAAAKALEVIDATESGTYSYNMYDEYRLVHSKQEDQKNTESLLGFYFSGATGTGDSSHSARGCISDMHEICGGAYNNQRAEFGFYCKFPDGDRKEWTYAPVTYHSTKGKAFDWWSEEIPENERQPYFRKTAFTSWNNATYANAEYDHWKSFDAQCTGWTTQTFHVIRLPEVYLWYAEAIGRSGQTNTRAVELLNRVRNRANGAKDPARDIYGPSMTANELAEAAYNEHGWEIAGWNWGAIAPRYSDQQRMNRVKDAYNERLANPEWIIPGTEGVIMQEPFNPVEGWSDEKMFVPYPATDKRMNPNLENVNKLQLIK